MPDDSDTKAFARLRDTGAGKRFRLAVHEAAIARQYIDRGRAALDVKSTEAWRRAYIRATENASIALTQLSASHQWPMESQADLTFVWKPKDARRWCWRTEHFTR